jgi:hypothetical protein
LLTVGINIFVYHVVIFAADLTYHSHAALLPLIQAKTVTFHLKENRNQGEDWCHPFPSAARSLGEDS